MLPFIAHRQFIRALHHDHESQALSTLVDLDPARVEQQLLLDPGELISLALERRMDHLAAALVPRLAEWLPRHPEILHSSVPVDPVRPFAHPALGQTRLGSDVVREYQSRVADGKQDTLAQTLGQMMHLGFDVDQPYDCTHALPTQNDCGTLRDRLNAADPVWMARAQVTA